MNIYMLLGSNNVQNTHKQNQWKVWKFMDNLKGFGNNSHKSSICQDSTQLWIRLHMTFLNLF